MSDDYNETDDVVTFEDDNIEEETYDMKNAEQQSIDATDKAQEPGKKAKSRKGDNTKQDAMEKVPSRKEMLNAMYGKMSKMDSKSLNAMYNKMSEDYDLDDVEVVEEDAYDFDAEFKSIMESEATLSDEFKEKSALIFNTAIKSEIAEQVGRIEDEYQSRLEEEIELTRETLVEQVDDYLNYVVEQWIKENELAVESGLRAEISEDFMKGLRNLFVESYIEVPESKIDLVDELADKVEEVESKLDETTAHNLEMIAELEEMKREKIVRENSDGLAETEVEKLNSLVENLDFEDEESFAEKVKTVKESYFKKEKSEEDDGVIFEDVESDDADEKHVSSNMSRYLTALSRTNTSGQSTK